MFGVVPGGPCVSHVMLASGAVCILGFMAWQA